MKPPWDQRVKSQVRRKVPRTYDLGHSPAPKHPSSSCISHSDLQPHYLQSWSQATSNSSSQYKILHSNSTVQITSRCLEKRISLALRCSLPTSNPRSRNWVNIRRGLSTYDRFPSLVLTSGYFAITNRAEEAAIRSIHTLRKSVSKQPFEPPAITRRT